MTPEIESLADFLARVRRQDEAHGGIRHKTPTPGCPACKENPDAPDPEDA